MQDAVKRGDVRGFLECIKDLPNEKLQIVICALEKESVTPRQLIESEVSMQVHAVHARCIMTYTCVPLPT